MAANQTCLDIVQRDIKDMSEKELGEVLEQMKGRQAVLLRQGVDPNLAASQAGMEVAEMLRAAAAIERRNALINRRVRVEALDYVRTTWSDNLAEGVLSIIYGSSHARPGSRASANAAQSALLRRYLGGVTGELEAAGLFDVLKRGDMDRDVFAAMRSIKDESALARMPEQAVAIARILDKWQEVSRVEANRAGAWIGKLEDYGLRQSHNSDALMKAGEAQWTSDIRPKLDLDRMFPNGAREDLDGWLHETFLNIVSGVREVSTGIKDAAFKGPGNLAKKLSQQRVIHFRTADDAFDYNARYGMGNVREAFVAGMHKAAESTGLMQVLGTNPEGNMTAIVDAIRSNLSRSDPAALKKFDNATRGGKRIENGMKEVSGVTRRAASARMATVGQGIRAWNSLTGLGGAVVSAITDVPTRASLLRYQGDSYLKQLGKGLIDPLTRLTDGMASKERKAVLAASGYFNEVALSNLVARFNPDENAPGAMSRAVGTFFKLNLLAQWTDSMRRSTLEAMAHYWGSIADTDWRGLSDRNRNALERFRIGEHEWAAISGGLAEADGQKFLTPQAVRELPADTFAGLATDRINALKVGTAERVQARMKQDVRELEWVSKRSDNLKEALESAVTRLNERIANTEGSVKSDLSDLSAKLSSLYGKVDTASSYWQTVRGRIPSVSKVVSAATGSERQSKAVSGLLRAQKEASQALLELKASKQVEFESKWDERLAKLNESLEKSGDEDSTNARLGQYDEAFAAANAAITERLAKADERSTAQLTKLGERLTKAKGALDAANGEIAAAKAAAPHTGELRSAGVTEGRAVEAAKNIKSEARQIGRDLERLKKQLNEDFVEKWSDRQDEFVAFSDRIKERVEMRKEINARELGNLDPSIARVLDDTRAQMADRLQQFYADDLDSAVISPDARTNAFVRQGQQAGTAIGEALRLFWQFKSFGIAVMQRAFLRELNGYGPKFSTSTLKGLSIYMLGSLGFGYAAMTLKDLIKGKKPRPVDHPTTWAAAMSQGGGMGIYGDFLFGEASRTGGGLAETLGGPTVGKAGDALRLFQAAKRGDDVAAQSLRFAINNIPGNNLFYARTAADYLFLYGLQEEMNPGYLRRMERRAEQERGQEWWLRPSEAAR